MDKMPSARPRCLITGASDGIGFAAAEALARLGFRLVLACRDPAKAEAARAAIAAKTGAADSEILRVDFASQPSMRRAAREFLDRHEALDVLINNAGLAALARQESPDGVELTFAVNVLGYFLFTNLLLDALRRAPAGRVVSVSSRMAHSLDLDDLEFKKRRFNAASAYAQSKQADRLLAWALARRLADTPVTVNAVCPGPVNTKLLHAFFPGIAGRSPAAGADTIVWLASAPEVAGVTGKLWEDRREIRCKFRDRDEEESLWMICERMTREAASPRG
jgi:NAD(P)-dependent dehydrogenase (short-subunit alcohol dehydrogenase family)